MTHLELPITITIERELKSLNAVRGRHWGAKNDEKQGWYQDLTASVAEITGRLRFDPPTEKRHVTVTRILGPRQRELDFDNLAGGAKPLVDAGTLIGLWRNDSPEWLEVDYRQDASRRKAGPAVELKIEEA